MIISTCNPEVALLKQIWDSADRRTEGLAKALQRRLARSILAPALRAHEGELILKYHEFLSMRPSDFHNSAHGSRMESKTVRWVSVARLLDGEIEEIPEERHPSPRERLVFSTPSKVLVPVLWENNLEPRYRRNTRVPHFIFGKMIEQNEGKYDLALLGQHLFRLHRGDLDWFTETEIVVGNESVGAWLRERKSAQAFNMLIRR